MDHGSLRKLLGTLLWGPYNKDPTIQGTILGSPIFGNSRHGSRRMSGSLQLRGVQTSERRLRPSATV